MFIGKFYSNDKRSFKFSYSNNVKNVFRVLIITLLIFSFSNNSYSQSNSGNKFVEWTTWTLFQTIPSPTFYQDRNDGNARLQFGLRWNVTPFNYSFNANKLIPAAQFFKVNPVRRYGGSMEIFLQPEWATGNFQYSDFKRFNLTTGVRGFIPLEERGEYLAISLGGKYNFRKNKQDQNIGYYSVEGGIYTFFGILGLVADYNFTSQSYYNISINLKYY
ncbi:MAG TPA: hypothetical protein PLD63_05640 [Ignavibacteria bacterium]|nr:hypothetical protein [Ignavibacteria bacterium]HQY51834.1 hypothetical protein [Ignavibacteria bacterium]